MTDETQEANALITTATSPSVSERKRKANQNNAKSSTGPRTVRGKANSRMNAVKHGMLASDLFPRVGLPTESQTEFLDLCDRLREQYQPVGSSEEWEVERIAICMWRLRRGWHYENAEIHKAVEPDFVEKSHLYRESLRKDMRFYVWPSKTPARETETTPEISLESALWVRAKNGQLWPELNGFALRYPELQPELIELANLTSQQYVKLAKKNKKRELTSEDVAYSVNFIMERPVVKRLLDARVRISSEQHSIPNRAVIDKVVRYEAASDRALSHAVERLERLQRTRKGTGGSSRRRDR